MWRTPTGAITDNSADLVPIEDYEFDLGLNVSGLAATSYKHRQKLQYGGKRLIDPSDAPTAHNRKNSKKALSLTVAAKRIVKLMKAMGY
jgi:hypothetical protein